MDRIASESDEQLIKKLCSHVRVGDLDALRTFLLNAATPLDYVNLTEIYVRHTSNCTDWKQRNLELAYFLQHEINKVQIKGVPRYKGFFTEKRQAYDRMLLIRKGK